MTRTKTAQAYHAEVARSSEARREIFEIAKDEFPIGQKVRWIHTYTGEDYHNRQPVYRQGTVVNMSEFEATVRMKTSATHRVRLYQLEHAEPVAPAI